MTKRSNVRREPRGSVRIIGGEWRGRRLRVSPGTAVRPTPDRVRETVFNWLRELVPGAACLDLYAGTGVLGFEALSRGAAEAWFVEADGQLVAAIREHAETLGARPRIVRQDAAAFLKTDAPRKFDIAFVDPPYAEPVEPLFASLGQWLGIGAVVYVERPAGAGLPDVPGGRWWRRARAGAVEFGLLTFESAPT
jgi:16S rRNA (guanine966-N2)-methyltransferase